MSKRIVIVGGGPAGTQLARALDDVADVTLIEPRSHFVHAPAMIRTLVTPELLERALIPYGAYLKRGRHLRGKAVAVDEGGVTLDDGSRVEGDVIVIATGSENATPFKPKGADIEAFRAEVARVHGMLEAARSVAIVGAGAVGTELAGEIAHFMPEKAVTLISDQPSLFPDKPARFGRALAKKLQAAGVKLVFGARAENLESLSEPYAGRLRLTNGEEIEADLIFPTIGSRAVTDLLDALPGVEKVSANRVKVDPWLRPSSLPNVFAVGDIADTGDGMSIISLSRQVPWLAKTLKAVLKGRAVESLKPYAKWKNAPILVPLGPEKGNTFLGGLTLGDWATSRMKGRGLFLARRRKELAAD
ncbi:MAG: N-acyl homoserine lactone synthase [Alphaproteobacteria bacterium]|nr:MAG: N-acyl homoserine lactone synthase [Alphaproteobacteria bacterium]